MRRFCSAVLTSAFCARVSASSLAWAFLIAVSVDFWSRSRCFCAVSSVSFAASTDCWAWVMASASCCLLDVGRARLRLGQRRLGVGQLGLRGVERGLRRRGVDRGEHLARW